MINVFFSPVLRLKEVASTEKSGLEKTIFATRSVPPPTLETSIVTDLVCPSVTAPKLISDGKTSILGLTGTVPLPIRAMDEGLPNALWAMDR
ncbi:MAG: hypothetical protein A3F84_23915 [Candidatus Handelsmanbacteria bacterium RIFCSPLOWO2_12_FULL_64_10]|uniref:Uncharacterized protein n=1 Tax=Handelsmanbacteria sp. (strain RIFCSPLOWO2_12_FULL_64_10) TaxID=1817868 RepID=A0A1F6CAA6_HANXR|nr:MAG: hypothetical protein A3F84_23915 [Candidatus Handelsmanbacteria bacterium RIFCSPLOWO2_12_FULL_64_10]